MGSRGASAALNASQPSISSGYVFNGTLSRNANIQAAYNSIKDKGNGTLADFKDMVDYETRGADGYGLKDGIEAALEGYSDTYGGNSTNREQRISEIVRKLDAGNFKSAAERDKLRAEYDRLNNERSVDTLRRTNARNNIKGVWQ